MPSLEAWRAGEMELSLGADHSAVRVHEGDVAPSIGAEALIHRHEPAAEK